MGKTYELIHDLCKERKTSIPKMCKETGLSRSLFAELKSGRTKRLSTKTLETVATFLNVPITYFLDFVEPNPADIPPLQPASRDQVLFALYKEVPEEITDEEMEEIQQYAKMVLLRKRTQKAEKGE